MDQYRKINRTVKNDIVLLHLCSGDDVHAVLCCAGGDLCVTHVTAVATVLYSTVLYSYVQ